MVTKEELFEILCAKEYTRYYSRQLALQNLEVIAREIQNEKPLAVCLGFEDTPRGSGHSLAMVLCKTDLYFGTGYNAPHTVRVPLARIRKCYWDSPCMVLEFSTGTVRIRTDENFVRAVQNQM